MRIFDNLRMKFVLSRLPEDVRAKFEKVLSSNTQETIVLKFLLQRGSVTVRDLLPKMNYPCGPIRDLQSVFGIALVYDWETKEKTVVSADGKERTQKIKYKRYRLAEV